MSWQGFLNNLIPEDSNQGRVLLEKFIDMKTAPDISWYPGSGRDLTPLLLDVPGNPTQRRLLRMGGESDGTPLLFWMNDSADGLYGDYPEDSLLGQEYAQEYPNLWKEYDSTATIGQRNECYRYNGEIRITLFTITVSNKDSGEHWRGVGGDEYLVCFAYCDSEKLFKEIFVPHHLHISHVALVKQGGLFGQRCDFDQYGHLPDMVTKHSGSIGEVDLWIIDRYGQEERRPIAKSLINHVYVGGPLRWGWPPARIYARPGTAYLAEKRKQRIGRSWLS